MVDLDSDPTKLIDVVEIGKQLLITRGALTTFSIANDVAKYFAIIPAMFVAAYPGLDALNVMRLTLTGVGDPVRGDLQRADHRRADPAGPARRPLPAGLGGRAAAAQPAALRRRRHHRALPRASRSSTCSSPSSPESDEPTMPEPSASCCTGAPRRSLVLTVLLGIAYPLLVTRASAQVAFPDRSRGSLVVARRRPWSAPRCSARSSTVTSGSSPRPVGRRLRRAGQRRLQPRTQRAGPADRRSTSAGPRRRRPRGGRPRPGAARRGHRLRPPAWTRTSPPRTPSSRSTGWPAPAAWPGRRSGRWSPSTPRAARWASSASRGSTCVELNLAAR